MGIQDRHLALEQAFDRIEGTILPDLSMMLQALLEQTAAAANPENDSLRCAAELKAMGVQLQDLVRQVESCCPPDFRFTGLGFATNA